MIFFLHGNIIVGVISVKTERWGLRFRSQIVRNKPKTHNATMQYIENNTPDVQIGLLF